jgi:peptidoglycan/xylan/chitin deacetylase (PgdA/CDA1 family)
MLPRSDTLVLCYHAISDGWKDSVAVSRSRLAGHMQLLKRRGYRGVTFNEAVLQSSPERRVAITFDDAFVSVAALAAPILRSYGWPGTVFAVSSCAESGGVASWPRLDAWLGTDSEAELRTMGWDELRRLHREGWEIGSHTVTHPYLTRLPSEEVLRELADSRITIEAQLREPCRSIAYPYGDVDGRVAAIAREAGYAAGAALPAGLHAEHELQWPRVGVYEKDHPLRFLAKTMPGFRRLRTRGG